MAFNLRQWVTRSIALALAGEDMLTTSVLDPEDIAETYAHHVMYEVCEEFAADPNLSSLVTESLTVALTNGIGTLPEKALVRFLSKAVVSDPADATLARKMRYLPWEAFIRQNTSNANRGYFSVNALNQFALIRPSAAYTPGTGMTGNITLTIPTAPDMPANETATITVTRQVEEALVRRLAEKIRVPRRREAA